MARSLRRLDEQREQIRLALRSALMDEDRYLVRDCGTSHEREVPVVLPGHAEPSPIRVKGRTEAEYAAPVHALLDLLPKHLLLHLPAAYARLSYTERVVLHLAVRCGHRHTAIAAALGWKRPGRIRDTVDGALTQLARALWSEDGHAILPPER